MATAKKAKKAMSKSAKTAPGKAAKKSPKKAPKKSPKKAPKKTPRTAAGTSAFVAPAVVTKGYLEDLVELLKKTADALQADGLSAQATSVQDAIGNLRTALEGVPGGWQSTLK